MAPAHDFHSWVKQSGEHWGIIFRDEEVVPEPGKPGEGAGVAKVKYVPYPMLQEYWTTDNINQVLSDADLISIPAEDIRSDFLRIFSILVMIIDKDLKLPYLQRFMKANFTDRSLPLARGNETRNNTVLFTDSKIDEEAFEAFNMHQFRFNHIQFTRTDHHELNEQMIIPATFDKWLTAVGYGKPAIALCTVPSSEAIGFNVKNGKIAVKVCDRENDKESFLREKGAEIAFKNLGSRHNSRGILNEYHEFFLRYYGSLVQGTKGLLFVEYATQGSLKQFFESNRPPHTLDELVKFWESFNQVFVGLHWLHGGSSGGIELLKELEKVHGLKTVPGGEGKLRVGGVHQDIKPDNIFVFRHEDKEKFNLRFKIGDLGSSSIRVTRRTAPKVEESYQENQSTKMYSAPELFNPHPDMAEGTTITREADIWSLGCVMAEAAVWSICGLDGLIEFWEARREETMKQEYRIAGESSYSAAFHNGRILLPNFDGLMAAMLSRKRVFDNTTQVVIDLVKDQMLVPLPERRNHQIQNIRCELGRLLLEAKEAARNDTLAQPASRTLVPTQASGPTTQITESSHTVIPHQTENAETLLHTPLQPTAPPTRGSEAGELPRTATQPAVFRQTENRTRHPTSTLPGSTSTATIEKLPLRQILKYTKTKIHKHRLDTEGARRIGARLRENKQIFILQDSTSIRSCHWDRVSITFAALTHLLETKELGAKSEKNMHLHLTSKPANPLRIEIDNQRQAVDHADLTLGGPASETAKGLTQIIQGIAKFLSQNKPDHRFLKSKAATPAREGMDIYLLTDGVLDDIDADTGFPKSPDLVPFGQEMDKLVNLLPGAKVSIRMILLRDDEVARRLSTEFERLSKEKAWSFSHCPYDWSDAWRMLDSGE